MNVCECVWVPADCHAFNFRSCWQLIIVTLIKWWSHQENWKWIERMCTKHDGRGSNASNVFPRIFKNLRSLLPFWNRIFWILTFLIHNQLFHETKSRFPNNFSLNWAVDVSEVPNGLAITFMSSMLKQIESQCREEREQEGRWESHRNNLVCIVPAKNAFLEEFFIFLLNSIKRQQQNCIVYAVPICTLP